jgi:hypothetical protein
MIGIGTPMSQSRIERMTNASVMPARRNNEPAPEGFRIGQPIASTISGVSASFRRPDKEARSMMAAA